MINNVSQGCYHPVQPTVIFQGPPQPHLSVRWDGDCRPLCPGLNSHHSDVVLMPLWQLHHRCPEMPVPKGPFDLSASLKAYEWCFSQSQHLFWEKFPNNYLQSNFWSGKMWFWPLGRQMICLQRWKCNWEYWDEEGEAKRPDFLKIDDGFEAGLFF